MWSIIFKAFGEQLESGKETLTKKFTGFGTSAFELIEALRSFRQQSWNQLNKKLKDEFGDDRILLRLRNRFNEKFRYDEDGLPRVWRPSDDIDSLFVTATEEASKLFNLYSKIAVPISDLIDLVEPENETLPLSLTTDPLHLYSMLSKFEPSLNATSLIIVSPARIIGLKERFKRECDAQFLEAKRSTVAVTAKVPFWMYGLLVFFGMNEVIWVLSNPLFAISMLLMALVTVGLWYTKLLGPVLIALRTSASAITVQLQEQFTAYLSAAPAEKINIPPIRIGSSAREEKTVIASSNSDGILLEEMKVKVKRGAE
ncbi:Dynamin-like GTPase that mediates homotypic ER fusion, partial [Nowakowskiella sp. JEL0078]